MFRPNWFNKTFLLVGTGLLAGLVLTGCGDDEKPDTGYGEGQSPPSTVSCAEFCQRAADCGGHLCAEDTGKDLYIDFFEAMEAQCEATCTDSLLSSRVTNTNWTCLFKSSCRQVFDHDACNVQANYYCK